MNRRLTIRLYAYEEAPAEGAVQDRVCLTDRTEPEPDLVLLRPGAYGVPRPEDVLLAVEVADMTLAYDRSTKLPRYADSATAEVWILALSEEAVCVYRRPGAGRYSLEIVRRRGEVLVDL